MSEITCFKAYDVRGRVPDQLNEDVARRIGRAYAEVIRPRQVVVGHDIRLTSQAIKAAVTQGLREQGVDVYDIGQCGTEEIYFATSHAGMDGGIAVTASQAQHRPPRAAEEHQCAHHGEKAKHKPHDRRRARSRSPGRF